MKITIIQQALTLGATYNISYAGRKLIAKRRWFSFLSIIDLYDKEEVIVSIKRKFSLIRAKYFIWTKHNQFLFYSKTLWKPTYECIGQDEQYEIITHRGVKHSIFHNNSQIGAITKSIITFGRHGGYEILVNKKSNHYIIIAIALILDNHLNEDSCLSFINIDFGNIGSETKSFNNDWKPQC